MWISILMELLSRFHMTGMSHQRMEHHELGNGEAHRCPLPLHAVTLQVELEISGAQRWYLANWRGVLIVRGATKQDLHACEQLAHRERLAQIVVSANLQAEHAIDLLIARGQKD